MRKIYTHLPQLIEGYSVSLNIINIKMHKKTNWGMKQTQSMFFVSQTDISHVNHILKSHLVVKFQNTQEGMSELLVICKP